MKYILLCTVFIGFVSGHPVDETLKTNVTTKNYKKFVLPTITDVKILEREVWKAAVNGDTERAKLLQNRLERDVLGAALGVLAQNADDPARIRRDLQQLDSVVRREKRTTKMLADSSKPEKKPDFESLINKKKEKQRIIGSTPNEQSLIRRARQGFHLENTDDSTNEILPPSQSPTTTSNPLNTTSAITNQTIAINDSLTANTNREQVTTRQQNNNTSTNVPARQEEEDDEEGGGGLGGLITSFLGSLSTPEGGVDLDAVTGLLGGISTQNDDGTYDFTGLQDTVGSLFGGGEEGGSNIGLFLGGLVGAILRGSAGDDAAKGAGRLAGNLLAALLPNLSAYPTPEEGPDGEPGKAPEGLDSGGFLSGFLSTILGGLGGLSNSNSSGNKDDGQMDNAKPSIFQFKFQIIKSIFSIFTKILGASSSSKQHPKDH